MADHDRLIKGSLSNFFRNIGFRVTEIPRSESKTPDLLVESESNETTLVEIKQKLHYQEELDAYLKTMENGGISSRSRPTGYRNRLDGLIHEGVKQLQTKDPYRQHNHVMWIHCEGYDETLNEMQMRATMYGTQKLFSMDTKYPNIITCFYFWNSSFFRFRSDLEGIVLSCGNEVQLMLNDHSVRFEGFRKASFVSTFRQAVFYPRQYRLEDDAMICDHDGPRNTESETLTFLRKKYGLQHLQTISMDMHEVVVSVQRNET